MKRVFAKDQQMATYCKSFNARFLITLFQSTRWDVYSFSEEWVYLSTP